MAESEIEAGDERELDGEEEEDEEGEEEGEEEGPPRRKRKKDDAAASSRLVRAVEQRRAREAARRRQSASKKEHRLLFPVRGIECACCMLRDRIAPVDAFVQTNLARMDEESLWRCAAHVYKREVASKAERVGLRAPRISWKTMKTHYEWHVLMRRVTLAHNVRTLRVLSERSVSEMMRVRPVDPDEADMPGFAGGDPVRRQEDLEIDAKRVDTYLRVLAQLDKEQEKLDSLPLPSAPQ